MGVPLSHGPLVVIDVEGGGATEPRANSESVFGRNEEVFVCGLDRGQPHQLPLEKQKTTKPTERKQSLVKQ